MRPLPVLVVAALALWPLAGHSAHAANGAKLENTELPSLDGGMRGFLGKAKASVFVFFQPGQQHSHDALVEMSRCEKELAGKPVHWAAIASDKYPKADIEAAVKAAGVRMPVLLDSGDALYSRLGVIMHPMVGVADGAQVLVAFQPFTKLNYCELIKAHVLHTLNELSDADLVKVLNPAASTTGGSSEEARRHLKLGEMLLKAGNSEKALENAKKAVEKDSGLAPAHSLLGAVLAARGDCPGAAKEFDAALALDPKDARGLAGKKNQCPPAASKP